MHDRYIHALVCAAFHSPAPGHAFEVNHKNGRKEDNAESNLEWVTHSGNHLHRHHVLGIHLPTGRPQARLTEADVREIRALAPTVGRKELAARFGIHPTYVSAIVRRKNWAHV